MKQIYSCTSKKKLKISEMKIEIIGTCPNFQLSPVGILIL
jgi:hypothetical protein